MAISVIGLEFEVDDEPVPPAYPTNYRGSLLGVALMREWPFNRCGVKTEVCATALSSEVFLRSDSLGVDKVDIFAFDNAAYVTPIYEDGTTGDELEVPRNAFRSLDGRIRGFKHRNVTPLWIATVEVAGWWRA